MCWKRKCCITKVITNISTQLQSASHTLSFQMQNACLPRAFSRCERWPDPSSSSTHRISNPKIFKAEQLFISTVSSQIFLLHLYICVCACVRVVLFILKYKFSHYTYPCISGGHHCDVTRDTLVYETTSCHERSFSVVSSSKKDWTSIPLNKHHWNILIWKVINPSYVKLCLENNFCSFLLSYRHNALFLKKAESYYHHYLLHNPRWFL